MVCHVLRTLFLDTLQHIMLSFFLFIWSIFLAILTRYLSKIFVKITHFTVVCQVLYIFVYRYICLQILPNDAQARRLFVISGGLKKVQEIQAEPGTVLFEYITIINCCFPEEIIRLSFLLLYIFSDIYLFNINLQKYHYSLHEKKETIPFIYFFVFF